MSSSLWALCLGYVASVTSIRKSQIMWGVFLRVPHSCCVHVVARVREGQLAG